MSPQPHRRATFFLDSDDQLPRDQRMRFFVRLITDAERQQHETLEQQLIAATDLQAQYKVARDMLAIGVVGWENVKYPPDYENEVLRGKPVPFDFNELMSSGVLIAQEFWSLVQGYPQAVRPVKADLKN